jgi:hypothetical protein
MGNGSVGKFIGNKKIVGYVYWSRSDISSYAIHTMALHDLATKYGLYELDHPISPSGHKNGFDEFGVYVSGWYRRWWYGEEKVMIEVFLAEAKKYFARHNVNAETKIEVRRYH